MLNKENLQKNCIKLNKLVTKINKNKNDEKTRQRAI